MADDGPSYDPSYDYDIKEKPTVYSLGIGAGQDEDGYLEAELDTALEPADYWTIISAYFEGKGLVRQQLDSYNEFVENTIQEIVDENSRLTLDQYTQYTGQEGDETVCFFPARSGWAGRSSGTQITDEHQRRYEINFGQIYLARPATTESDGTVNPLFPQEARLRNLTYSAPLYVDVTKRAMTAAGVEDPTEADWQPIKDEYGNEPDREEQKVWIGKVSLSVLNGRLFYLWSGADPDRCPS